MSIEFTPGNTVTLTASYTGNAENVGYQWIVPAGSSAPVSNTNVLEWETIKGDEGEYTVEVSSPTSFDSPVTGTIQLDPAPIVFDPDALDYIQRVELGDGEPLEDEVKVAINTFVVALKSTTAWNAIVGYSPLVGARTLEGAMVSLKGEPLQGTNLVSGDYSRTKGIIGDGISKCALSWSLNPIIANNHYSAYIDNTTGTVMGYNNRDTNRFDIESFGTVSFSCLCPIIPSSIPPQGFVGAASNSDTTVEIWHSVVETLTPASRLPYELGAKPFGILAKVNNGFYWEGYCTGTINNVSFGDYYDQPMQVRSAIIQYLDDLSISLPPTRQFVADEPTIADVNEA